MRLAMVGIGNELRRDDAVGLACCAALRRRVARRQDVIVVWGGPAPENCTGSLRRFAPDIVVLVDAADMGEPPGAIRWIPAQAAGSAHAGSTHTLPLSSFSEFLTASLGCQVHLVGIQPADTRFGEGLTPAVAQAAEELALALAGGTPWVEAGVAKADHQGVPPGRMETRSLAEAELERRP
jgi:hydrogenase 3 maturation protease